MAKRGLSNETMAALLGVARSTLQAHLSEDVAAKTAYDLGRAELEGDFLDATLTLAKAGHSTFGRYWFENRFGWRRHKQIEISGVGGGPVEVADLRAIALNRLTQFLRNQESQ